jgi:leucyl-tRNA synthetase
VSRRIWDRIPEVSGGYDAGSVEGKWQKRWRDSKLFDSEPEEGKEKFYIIFAYPGVSGYLHVGHMRGYTYTDVIARYKRMKGYNVLFPVGSHASGNIAIAFARKIERGDEDHIEYLRANGCPEVEIPKLTDPQEVVRFFNDVYVNEYWRRFGFSADFRRFTCTVFEDYKRFIQWQFRQLKEKGLLIQKEYYSEFCPVEGPVAVDPSETDIQRGGRAEKLEYTLLKFRMDDCYLLAATLRPETVFGQTNFWANPGTTYVKAKVDGETWIISRECAEKLKWQKDSVEVTGELNGRDLIGKKCRTPYIDKDVLVLPASFCEPDVGTGLVTSVPSDAPIDWMALKDLAGNEEECAKYGLKTEDVKAIQPVAIIKTKGYGDHPAVEICDEMGIRDQTDSRLEEATKVIYKAGFHSGVMNENCGKYAGMTVAQAKDAIRDEMIGLGIADVMYDLSEEVLCRCGERVLIKKIDDQWFINYGDEDLTRKSIAQAEGMGIYPKEYGDNIKNVLEWFKERACVRMGNWLGTRFPFDEKWIIEPISDSTLYPSYYTVSKYVNSGDIKPEQLTDEFFDHVFLGRGSAREVSDSTGIDVKRVEKIRSDFEYWYPLDMNLGGKEHMTVHFPVFLMNHVAILPEKDWPRGIFTNWWITWKGGMRISKSKGGAVPIPNAAERFTVDGMRLYYTHIASPFVDVEWDEDKVQLARDKLERIHNLIDDVMKLDGQASPIDKWLISRTNSRLKTIEVAMDSYELRETVNEIFYGIESDIRWYLKRGGENRETLREVLDVWIRLMSPFTPHLAEELWERIGKKPFVSIADYPTAKEENIDRLAEESERYLISISDDISEILKVTKIKPKNIYIFTANGDQRNIFEVALDLKRKGELNVKRIIELAQEGGITDRSFIGAYASGIMKELAKWSPTDIDRYTSFDEKAYLEDASAFLEAQFGCGIKIHSADEDVHDPNKKRMKAIPWKPGIYVE